MPLDATAPHAPIAWQEGRLRLLDQTRLPHDVVFIEAQDYGDVTDAIRRLAVRGAPLIGIAAAYGLALASRAGADLRRAAAELAASRPTAVNLRWALDRVLGATADAADPAAAAETEARRIHQEQIAGDLRIGESGAALIADGATLLTHCNTGALATGGIGTALGVVKTAHWQGKRVSVFACETRPLLQGARLTAWELQQEDIPFRLLADAAAPAMIARGGVSAVIVGADRIAANGDVANKIGTYALALAAREHEVPFYVAAPCSTIDLRTPTGEAIPIEERDPSEITGQAAPDGSDALNPAFDVTPARCVTAIVTERGVLRAPFALTIADALRAEQAMAR